MLKRRINDGWHLGGALSRPFFKHFEKANTEINRTDDRFKSHFRKKNEYFGDKKCAEIVKVEDILRYFLKVISPNVDHFRWSKLLKHLYAPILMSKGVRNSLDHFVAHFKLPSTKRVKPDELTEGISQWADKCNAFEASVFEYIEFEKLIELLTENAFKKIYIFEMECKNMPQSGESSPLTRSHSSMSSHSRRSDKGKSGYKRSKSYLPRKSPTFEEAHLSKVPKDATILGQNAAALFTIFECGGYVQTIYSRWHRRFKLSKISFEIFMDEALKEVVFVASAHRNPKFILLKFLRFLVSFNKNSESWMDIAKTTRTEYVKSRKVVRRKMTDEAAVSILQRVWRGAKARKKISKRSRVEIQNDTWHSNRTTAIGQNIEKHFWCQQLFKIMTPKTSMSDENWEDFIQDTPVDILLKHDMKGILKRVTIKGELRIMDFATVGNAIIQKIYERIDKRKEGSVAYDQVAWLLEFILGIRDFNKAQKFKDWLKQRDGRVYKHFIIAFMKKFWLTSLSCKDDFHHKCYMGYLGTLLSLDSVLTMMPHQALSMAKKRNKKKMKLKLAVKRNQENLDKILEDKLSALKDKDEMTDAIAQRLKNKNTHLDPWGSPYDIGSNRGKGGPNLLTNKEIARQMLADKDFVYRNSFEHWESRMTKKVNNFMQGSDPSMQQIQLNAIAQFGAAAANSSSPASGMLVTGDVAAQQQQQQQQQRGDNDQDDHGRRTDDDLTTPPPPQRGVKGGKKKAPFVTTTTSSSSSSSSWKRLGTSSSSPYQQQQQFLVTKKQASAKKKKNKDNRRGGPRKSSSNSSGGHHHTHSAAAEKNKRKKDFLGLREVTARLGLKAEDIKSIVAKVTAEENKVRSSTNATSATSFVATTNQAHPSNASGSSSSSSSNNNNNSMSSSGGGSTMLLSSRRKSFDREVSRMYGMIQDKDKKSAKAENLDHLHSLAKPRRKINKLKKHMSSDEYFQEEFERHVKASKMIRSLPPEIEQRLLDNPRSRRLLGSKQQQQSRAGVVTPAEEQLTFSPFVCKGTLKIIEDKGVGLNERLQENIQLFVERRRETIRNNGSNYSDCESFEPQLSNREKNSKVVQGLHFQERLRRDLKLREEKRGKMRQLTDQQHSFSPRTNSSYSARIKESFEERLARDIQKRAAKNAKSPDKPVTNFQPEITNTSKKLAKSLGSFEDRLGRDIEKRRKREQKNKSDLEKKTPTRKWSRSPLKLSKKK